ncbi:hypothetical protein Oweho_1005 [Owenweeksia hongkongensis DSM 17368]|uniref:TfoX N-terminal domain-containing protein n=1 Tax=Owenweeksia hongkongensis (strain DSM 17368 / CIP 108786 / JCM 12287 / NRRL B-23963 / UST20020801) TaxID=926562 RepID=G8R3Y3_OWEHD|nr:hypothetical protein [Owenweeksia hongkongensis]AEV32015.1 hypothetical protein Oweho_1005 [Owenweeksia hongkongensis DSM 17368]
MTEQESLFNSIGEKLGEKSQMFGKPCYKVNKKAFACFFQNAMVFKLTDEAHKKALSLDGSQLFDPSGKGRAMKEWVQVPFDYKEQWKGFAEKALEYVGDR